MFQFLLSADVVPFTLALGILFGLLGLELILALMGGSLLASDSGGPDVDGPDVDGLDLDALDVDALDIDAADFDLGDLDLDGLEIDGLDVDGPDVDGPGGVDVGSDLAPATSAASVLGLGKTPFMIWFASILLGFGVSGFALQTIVSSLFGSPLPGWLATLPALAAAVGFARGFGGMFARLIPSTETESVSEKRLGRRRGTVTQGTAARGRPAEVRVMDGYGNAHYLRAEPLKDEDTIPQGREVIVLRDHRKGLYRLLAVD